MRIIDADKLEELGATCVARRNENGNLEAIISLDMIPTAIVNDYCMGYQDGVRKVLSEQKIGKAVITGETTKYYCCSVCGNPIDLQDNYCRRCGARIEAEE